MMRSALVISVLAVPAAGQGPNPTTSMGKCTTKCGASIFDAYKCDWCHNGALGSWGYCQYPGVSSFEAKSFHEKGKYFWDKIIANTTHAEYPSFTGTVTESARTSFYNWGDEMPEGRQKTIHGVGAVCKFKIENSAESPYTGLFEPGQQEGIIRLGSAVDYSNGGLTPGLGMKFVRTGRPSGNYVALHSLDFGQSWNFFASNLSNHIAPAAGIKQEVLVKKFNQASNCAPQVGLSDMAKYSQDGTQHASPKFPFKLFLVPSQQVQTPSTKKTIDTVNAEMAAFPIGTTLYTVYACGKAAGVSEQQPTAGGIEKACGSPMKLGAMVTTSKCTSSAYGDKSFHIRHQPVEEDWQVNPNILKEDGYDASTICGWSGSDISRAPGGCTRNKAASVMLNDDSVIV